MTKTIFFWMLHEKICPYRLPHVILPDTSVREDELSCCIQMGRKGLHLNYKAEFCFCSCLSAVAHGSPSMQVCQNIGLWWYQNWRTCEKLSSFVLIQSKRLGQDAQQYAHFMEEEVCLQGVRRWWLYFWFACSVHLFSLRTHGTVAGIRCVAGLAMHSEYVLFIILLCTKEKTPLFSEPTRILSIGDEHESCIW